MKRSRRLYALVAAALLCAFAAGAQASSCYIVHGADDSVLFRSPIPPVDMSGDFNAAVARRWPRARLMWIESGLCPLVDPVSLADAASDRGRLDPLRVGADSPARAAGSAASAPPPARKPLPVPAKRG